MKDSNTLRDPDTGTTFADEMRLIPRWSVALAVLAFVIVEYFFWIVIPANRNHPPPPIGFRIYFALSWGALAALYVLMVGYVSQDAPRRSMSLRFWIAICLIMPGGIGSVLYFLLRQPIVSRCPACGTRIQSDFHFCPQCACQVSACCGQCYRSVTATDQYCVHCGHDLAADNIPSRLRAVQA
jgi:hypothetical protein